MNSIKYRVWEKIEKRFLTYDDLYDFNHNEYMGINGYIDPSKYGFGLEFYGESLEFNLFTGLVDKKDKEIYDGDIVTNKTKTFSGNGYNGKNLIMKVERNENECFYQLTVCNKEFFGFKKLTKSISSDLEVIGNIYENSELISS